MGPTGVHRQPAFPPAGGNSAAPGRACVECSRCQSQRRLFWPADFTTYGCGYHASAGVAKRPVGGQCVGRTTQVPTRGSNHRKPVLTAC
eukprot:223817-Chlamydomonas_euryale.AAC.4